MKSSLTKYSNGNHMLMLVKHFAFAGLMFSRHLNHVSILTIFEIYFELQVIAGGHYDVDCFVTDPVNNVLYEERKKQYDSLTHTTAMKGVYKVCFSNEFSTFSHKTVYLDFRSGPDDRLLPGMNNPTALTQVKCAPTHTHTLIQTCSVVSRAQMFYCCFLFYTPVCTLHTYDLRQDLKEISVNKNHHVFTDRVNLHFHP